MKCLGIDEFKDTQKPSVKSGFIELDKITHGWENGNLIVIAGRPAMGKTSFGISLLRNIAVKDKIPIAFFSVEMTAKNFMNRFISAVSGGVEYGRIWAYKNRKSTALNDEEQDKLSDEELNKISEAEKQIDTAPVYLDDTVLLTIVGLQRRAMRLVSEFQIKLLVIDYLQLMSTGDASYNNAEEKTAIILRSLKGLAKDLNIPIIVLSQFCRGKSTGQYPDLDDLDKTIAEDADMVCFIRRPEYYHINEDDQGNDLHGMAEIIVAKNRNGETGKALLKFDKKSVSFYDIDK